MNRFLIAGQSEKIEKLLDATGCVTNDNELKKIFKNFSLSYAEIDTATLSDSLTNEYARIVLELYSTVARGEHEPSKTELTKFDTAKIYDTFPFVTRSPSTKGANFHFLGQTLGLFAGLKPGAIILEFGSGWGETTLALGRLGFDLTCVDTSLDFIELIRREAEVMGLYNLRGVVADFSIIGSLEQNFNAILFFECFYHCIDHVSPLEHCCKRLNPGGCLIFSGEPITADFPVPWGLRLDGQSLWSTASHGWLELGFSQSYFEDCYTKIDVTDLEFVIEVAQQTTFCFDRFELEYGSSI